MKKTWDSQQLDHNFERELEAKILVQESLGRENIMKLIVRMCISNGFINSFAKQNLMTLLEKLIDHQTMISDARPDLLPMVLKLPTYQPLPRPLGFPEGFELMFYCFLERKKFIM